MHATAINVSRILIPLHLCLTIAFLNIGVDHFGPILIPLNKGKLYVLLICYLQSLAVHLELNQSLNLEDFLKSCARFFARRGLPILIRSDNARTFISAALVLKEKHSIGWKFNISKAPWCGGVWERLIRNVKGSLKFALQNRRVTYVDLETSLCRIENIVNHRQMTYIITESDEIVSVSYYGSTSR